MKRVLLQNNPCNSRHRPKYKRTVMYWCASMDRFIVRLFNDAVLAEQIAYYGIRLEGDREWLVG
jgi:hypothetical protein